jgi:hypothetical protein
MRSPLSREVWKTLPVLLVAAGLAVLLRGTTLEHDPIRALSDPDPVRAALFEGYQRASVFRDRVFVEDGALTEEDRARLQEALRTAGYQEIPVFERPTPEQIFRLAPLLSPSDLRTLLDDEAIEARAQEAISVAMLPGGGAYLREIEADPLGLAPVLAARLLGHAGTQAGGAIRAYRGPRPIDFRRVEPAYDMLASLSPPLHYIGGDFFAVENYRAVLRDILVCSVVSLAITLGLFSLFTRRWALLGLLFLGSLISYLVGLLGLRIFHAEVYAVVLAYTSTFVTFNNEALVHLSGIEASRRKGQLVGIWSAIGTTLFGFVVLLFGRSLMVRQIAIASIGGMLGFLLFLLPYRSTLATIRIRPIALPSVTLRPWIVGVVCVASIGGILAVGIPRVGTRIDTFRIHTPALDDQVDHFSRRLSSLSLEDVVGVRVPAGGDPRESLRPLAARGVLDLSRHPLALWRSADEQEGALATLRSGYPRAVARLTERFARSGIQVQTVQDFPAAVHAIGGWEYLDLVGAIGPVRWTGTVNGDRFVMAGLSSRAPSELPDGLIPVSPRRYYDGLLTSASRELAWLFLAGLVVMGIYLSVLQRSFARVLYVLAPLSLSALAFAVYIRHAGATVDIIHVLAFSLIIALATDYASILVSTGHAPPEQAKILLTGASTLATFAVLWSARHPLLRELGATVTLGCAVSLAFALFVRLPAADEGPGA